MKTEMEIMKNRVRQMIFSFASEYTNLRIEKKSWGFDVYYTDFMGDEENIMIMELGIKRKSYVCRWVTNGNMKLRLPKYDRHYIG